MTAGDLNDDGFDDVVIGVPQDDVGGAADAGAVSVIYGSATGLTDVGNQWLHQNSAGIAAASATGDQFGSSVK